MTEWYENDEFWQDNYDVLFSEEAFRRAAEEVDRVLALLGAGPRHVLDLCCGPGRHSIPLAQRGVDVTAVDMSPFLLEKARENAHSAGVSMELVCADMRAFVRPSAFDAVLNLWTSFGYFQSRDDDVHVRANMFASLRPGGAVIIDVISTCIQRVAISHDWTMLDSEWILIRAAPRVTIELPTGSTLGSSCAK